jgi:Ca-activated chloride channel homolog
MITNYLHEIIFDWPWMLVLLLAIPFVVRWMIMRQEKNITTLGFPAVAHLQKMRSWRTKLRNSNLFIRGLAMVCLVVALAKPAHYQTLELTEGEGISIVLCLDVSGSMLARDLTPDRMRAAVQVARNFVSHRKGDRVGLVIFSGQSLSLCPLTSDLNAVQQQLNTIEYGQLADGTAIGSGLASAVDRLRESNTPGKVVILLTDGENTGGFIDPITAKQMAMSYGIKVYTVGVGSMGTAPMPYQTPSGTVLQEEKVSIDEGLLTDIAHSTGGLYFRATNTQALDSIYASINTIEKSKVESKIFTKRTDQFFPWVLAAIILLFIDFLLATIVFRRFP